MIHHPVRTTPLLAGTLQNLFYPPERSTYEYFARANGVPFSSGTALVRMAWAADAAMLAYARFGVERMTQQELSGCLNAVGFSTHTCIGNWDAKGTQGYFAANEEFAFLAFRGTEFDDPQDVQSDLDLFLSYEPDYHRAQADPKPTQAHLSFVELLSTKDVCLVHRGFQRALAVVWREAHSSVVEYRRQHPNAEIVFTGHSLGAALAVLAFSRLGDANSSLITFGCPRVGNAAFRERMLSIPSKMLLRVVNLQDPVTHVPPELGYCHAPESAYVFDGDGNLEEKIPVFSGNPTAILRALQALPASLAGALNTTAAPPFVVDHSPARYCIRLWNLV